MSRIVCNTLILLAAVVLLPGQANATPLIDFTSDDSSFVWFGNDAGCSGGCTLGYEFTLTGGSVAVDGLGVYDADSDGLNNDHEVGLWTAAGTLLASGSVGPSATAADTSASGTGQYLYTDIASLVLGPGTYVVGALYEAGDTDPVVFNASGIFSNDSAAAYSELRFVNSGTFGMPTGTATSGDRYFGPTLRIAEVTEPATALLTLAGLVGWSRRRRG